ncbi:hypothetical protein MCOR27_005464 [Pyricularia oryzae]|nr:hypothetical protein MCOR01_009124 [Pyricularia oryzae]KAI6260398.1 hypothetical protein MCOR19_003299 [Pyricularia oryzae]KAI6278744.1 hypothetical protein MCOR27_005464 [Pyricularia oryzae]KAI6412265.1 hypothetical protein MCOR20_003711 [Pyricularia oryzae]KAI6416567.1 hypothetical protein MCOR24_005928 [Pyricularia oryzae]
MPHVAGHMETLALFTLTHGDFDVPPSDSEALSVGYSTEDPVASGESDAGDANQASSPLKNTNPTEDERNKTNTCPNCDRKFSSKTKLNFIKASINSTRIPSSSAHPRGSAWRRNEAMNCAKDSNSVPPLATIQLGLEPIKRQILGFPRGVEKWYKFDSPRRRWLPFCKEVYNVQAVAIIPKPR